MLAEDENAKKDKASKLLACVNLTRSMFHLNPDFFKPTVLTLYPRGTDNYTKEDFQNELKTKILLNCYGRVSLIHSAEV